MLERLSSNIGLKILSVAIALAAWGYLRFTPNPVIAARFVQQVSVPIVTTGLADDEVAHLGDREAVLTVDVPRAGGEIRPQVVRAVLALAGRGPGVYNVPVEVIAPKLEIKSLSPASVTLTIERIATRDLPIFMHYTDVRRTVVVQHSGVAPSSVALRAPTSELARVVGARVDVALPGAPGTLDAMVRPVATDAHGSELPGIAVEPNLVRVRATFVAASRHR